MNGGLLCGMGKEESGAGLAAGIGWGRPSSCSVSRIRYHEYVGELGAVRLRGSSGVPQLSLTPW